MKVKVALCLELKLRGHMALASARFCTNTFSREERHKSYIMLVVLCLELRASEIVRTWKSLAR